MSITTFVVPTTKELSQRKIELYHRYSRIQQWGLKYPVEYCSRIMGIELLDLQKYAIYNSWTKDFVLWLESRNAGKALALDTVIPTPNGNTTMSEIKIGDLVFNEFGKPIKVIGVSEVFLNHKCYEVQFDDGEKIIADNEHLWYVTSDKLKLASNYQSKTGRVSKYDGVDVHGYKTVKTSDMINDYVIARKDGKGLSYQYRVPMNSPIVYEQTELPIDPYVLGLWLGDGSSAKALITSGYEDVDEINSYISEAGYVTEIYYPPDGINPPTITIDSRGKRNKNPFLTILKNIGVYNNKHIPHQYLMSSIEQRLALLRGLMDSDGACSKTGECTFSQKDPEFVKQFGTLLNSLGIKYSLTHRKKIRNFKTYDWFVISFVTDKTFSCFNLRRKYERLKNILTIRSKRKSIISIVPVSSVPTRCIKVDNPSGLFLCGEKYTVTHNTTKLAIYSMLRSLLIPFHITYFLGNTGELSPINIAMY